MPLLTTKLFIPPSRPGLVPRSHLLERLDEGLRLGHRLALVSAPAGFGNTTLIGAWACGSQRPFAWISLDNGDNDPVQFLHYLLAALQQVDDTVGRTTQQLIQSPPQPPLQSLAILVMNDVTAMTTPVTLVLDDYQFITSPAVHQVLQLLLENQPPSLHVVICTREDPPFPLPLWWVRGRMTEIRERDLRFTAAEAAAFLNQTMELSLTAEDAQAIAARAEGWIVGLQMPDSQGRCSVHPLSTGPELRSLRNIHACISVLK